MVNTGLSGYCKECIQNRQANILATPTPCNHCTAVDGWLIKKGWLRPSNCAEAAVQSRCLAIELTAVSALRSA